MALTVLPSRAELSLPFTCNFEDGQLIEMDLWLGIGAGGAHIGGRDTDPSGQDVNLFSLGDTTSVTLADGTLLLMMEPEQNRALIAGHDGAFEDGTCHLDLVARNEPVVVPQSSEAALWFRCDFPREGEVDSDRFGLFVEGGGTLVRHGIETNALWLETGDTVHLFAADEWPKGWLMSFNSKEMVAVSWSEGVPINSTECRVATE